MSTYLFYSFLSIGVVYSYLYEKKQKNNTRSTIDYMEKSDCSHILDKYLKSNDSEDYKNKNILKKYYDCASIKFI